MELGGAAESPVPSRREPVLCDRILAIEASEPHTLVCDACQAHVGRADYFCAACGVPLGEITARVTAAKTDALKLFALANIAFALASTIELVQVSQHPNSGLGGVYLFGAVGYAVAAAGWWGWSVAWPNHVWTDSRLRRPFKRLVVGYGIIVIADAFDIVHVAVNQAPIGAVSSSALIGGGAILSAWGFRNWGRGTTRPTTSPRSPEPGHRL